MFTCDLYAGVVPQMSPLPHDLERLRTTMVDFIFNRGRSVVSWTLYGYLAQRPVERAPAYLTKLFLKSATQQLCRLDFKWCPI